MPTRPSERLAPAAADYRWLLDRGYPDQGSLRLVGDRYRLSGTERNTLYRGVFAGADSERRARRLVDPRTLPAVASGPAAGEVVEELTVDGHNVLFTVWNCLAGRPIVLATDRFVRDIGGTRSRLPHDERFAAVARLLCNAIASLPFARVRIFLDEPLPWSRDHAGVIERVWEEVAPEAGVEFSAATEQSVDAEVARSVTGVIVTSDTAIVDRCAAPVLDLGGLIVVGDLGARPLEMAAMCAGG